MPLDIEQGQDPTEGTNLLTQVPHPMAMQTMPKESKRSSSRKPDEYPLLNPDLYSNDDVANILEKVEGYLKNPKKAKHEDALGRNALHLLLDTVPEGEIAIKVLEKFLESGIFTVNDQSSHEKGYYPVHYAASNAKHDLLSFLLQYEINGRSGQVAGQCKLKSKSGATALHLACTQSVSDSDLKGTEKQDEEQDDTKMCIELLLGADPITVSLPNIKGLTPVHIAIKSSKIWMFNLMFKHYDENTKMDERRPLLHYIASMNCDDESKGQILREIIGKLRSTINDVWKGDGKTPLEVAVSNNKLYTVVELLKEKLEFRITRGEEAETSAIFYAAMNGMTFDGNECFKKLLAYSVENLEIRGQLVHHLLKHRDANGQTVLDYVQSFCPPSTLKLMLDATLTAAESYKHEPLMVAYLEEHSGSASKVLQYIMDNSFSIKLDEKGSRQLNCDISCVTGVSKSKKDGGILDFIKQETGHIRNSINKWESSQKRDILKHPAMQLFVHLKYQRMRWIFRVLILLQLIWVAILTWFTVNLMDDSIFINKNWIDYIPPSIILAYSICSSMNELHELFIELVKFCMLSSPGINNYLLNITNCVQWIRNLVLGISSGYYIWGNSSSHLTTAKSLAAVGIVMASILAMRHLRHIHKMVGQSVDILQQVIWRVTKVFVSCLLILIGFLAAFQLLFNTFKQSQKNGDEVKLRLPVLHSLDMI